MNVIEVEGKDKEHIRDVVGLEFEKLLNNLTETVIEIFGEGGELNRIPVLENVCFNETTEDVSVVINKRLKEYFPTISVSFGE